MNWRRLLRSACCRRCTCYCVISCTLLAATLMVFVAHLTLDSSQQSPSAPSFPPHPCVERDDTGHSPPCPILAQTAAVDLLDRDTNPVTFLLPSDKQNEGVVEGPYDEESPDPVSSRLLGDKHNQGAVERPHDEEFPDKAAPLHEDDRLSDLAGDGREAMAEKSGEVEENQLAGDDPREAKRVQPPERGIPLVVVEEHHDVIPYWYAGVDLGLLPRHGNVLLHIDAHPDISLPFVNRSFPLFRYPDLSELVYLMQRNDMFITAAALTGLFSRYIWVVPPWDSRLEEVVGSSGYGRFRIFAGVVDHIQDRSVPPRRAEMGVAFKDGGNPQRGRPDEVDYPGLCYCVDIKTRVQARLRSSKGCFLHTNRSPERPLGVTKIISRKRCKARYHILAEVVSEDKAIELLQADAGPTDSDYDSEANSPGSGENKPVPAAERDPESVPWLSADDSILVDIDEDYYGVEAAVTPLEETLVSPFHVDAVSESVSRIFCPGNASQEATADNVFNNLLERLYRDLIHCRQDTTCVPHSPQNVEKFSAKLKGEMEHHHVTRFTCRDSLQELEDDIAHLVQLLLVLRGKQLRAMSKVGICLRESPGTMGFDPLRGMVVCTGHNRPNNSVVIFHVPGKVEIHDRSMKLFSLFHPVRFKPRAVTVSRSVRDGYTPRGSFRRIERDLIYILRTVYPQITEPTVIYDRNLLGGRHGWLNRH